MSLLHIDMIQVAEILPRVRQGLAYTIQPGRYHSCWWTGDVRGQGISNHDIYYVEPD